MLPPAASLRFAVALAVCLPQPPPLKCRGSLGLHPAGATGHAKLDFSFDEMGPGAVMCRGFLRSERCRM
jgi:hypothetical protein